AEAVEAGSRADAVVAGAEDLLKARDAALGELPARTPLETALAAHKERAKIEKALTAAQKTVATLEKEHAKATKAAAAAEKTAEDAGHVFESVRLQHRAHDLARELVAGEPCPVCGQDVHALPKVTVPTDLKKAEKDATGARAAHKAAADELVRVQRDAAVAAAQVVSLTGDASSLADALADHPDVEAIERTLAALVAADKERDAGRKAADGGRA